MKVQVTATHATTHKVLAQKVYEIPEGGDLKAAATEVLQQAQPQLAGLSWQVVISSTVVE